MVGVFSATDMIRQIDKESIRFFKDLKEKYIGSILNMVDLKDVNTAWFIVINMENDTNNEEYKISVHETIVLVIIGAAFTTLFIKILFF